MKYLFSLLSVLLFVSGCAPVKVLDDNEIRTLSERAIDADLQSVYDSAISSLINLGYTIDDKDEKFRYLNSGWKDLAGHQPVETMAGQLNTRVVLSFNSTSDSLTRVNYKLYARSTNRNSGDGSLVKVEFLREQANGFFEELNAQLD